MTVTAPYVDESATYGPTFASPSSITAPFLDSGVGFGADVSEDGTPNLSLTVAGVAVDYTFARSFRDQIDNTGAFSFSMLRADFLAASIDYDDEVQYLIDGTSKFLGIVRTIDHIALSPGELSDQVVTISGPGALGEMAQDLVRPSRGVGELPIEEVRSFSWPSVDFNFSSWGAAKMINRQREYANWFSPVPSVWPDTTGYWIWANQPSSTAVDAPVGTCLFRKTFNLAADATVRIFAAGDNLVTLYLDGAEMMSQGGTYQAGRYIELDLSAGDHYLAAAGTNSPRTSGENPGGFIAAVYTVVNGFLDTLVTHTDNTWSCLPYPDPTPGFTHGEVIIKLLEEAQAEDALTGWSWDFTATQDSAGEDWGAYREITAQVGRSLLDVLLEMSDAFIDVAVAPGSRTLRAWNRGGRGVVRATTLQQTTDPLTSDFLELSHQGRGTRMNSALIRYAGGHLEEDDAASITAHDRRSEYLELGDVKGEAEARRIAEQLIANRSAPAYATTARLFPRNAAATPYAGFEVADTITCPDENGDNDAMRVRSITLTEDDAGVIEWPVELRDQRYEVEERHDAWLRRMASGALLGGARVGSRAGTPQPFAQQVTALRVAEFSFDNSALVASLSPVRAAEMSGNIVEVYGQLTTAGSTTTEVDVFIGSVVLGGEIDDADVLCNLVFAAGETETEAPVVVVPIRANLDKLQVELLTAGSGAKGLDVQVRAI